MRYTLRSDHSVLVQEGATLELADEVMGVVERDGVGANGGLRQDDS